MSRRKQSSRSRHNFSRRIRFERLEDRRLMCGDCCHSGAEAAADFESLIELVVDTVGAPQRTGVAGHSDAVQSGGEGGLGEASDALADFDSLIELISSQVEPKGTTQAAGPSPTVEVDRDPADPSPLGKRLQDLQVTIEVRFITLRDEFFEEIGVDFGVDQVEPLPTPGAAEGPGGLTLGGSPQKADEVEVDDDDDWLKQSGFDTTPDFGQPSSNIGGMAILSDIEVFFFLEAAQADARGNVFQAPRVTMFGGQ